MTTSKEEKFRDRIRKLFAYMGSENATEREIARAKIVELLGKNKKTWNDLQDLLATGNTSGWHDDEPAVQESQNEQRRIRICQLNNLIRPCRSEGIEMRFATSASYHTRIRHYNWSAESLSWVVCHERVVAGIGGAQLYER